MTTQEELIPCQQQALERLREDDSNYVKYREASAAFWDKYEQTKSPEDLNHAIECYQQGLDYVSSVLYRARLLQDLRLAVETRFLATDDFQDLERSISYDRELLGLIREDSPKRSQFLLRLGVNYLLRWSKTNEAPDFEQAVKYHQLALEAISPDAFEACARISFSLGLVFQKGYQKSANLEDLRHSAHHLEKAVLGLSPESKDFQACLGDLPKLYWKLYEETDHLEDLDRCIGYYEQVLATEPIELIDRVLCLSNLGTAYEEKFNSTGQEADLNRSIECSNLAYEATPSSHSWVRASILGQGGGELGLRFERTGRLTDLNQSIDYTQQALNAMHLNDPNYQIVVLSLGLGFFNRFSRTNQLTDLDQCINCHHRALKSTPEDDRGHAVILNNLGEAYNARFNRTMDIIDLQESIHYHKRAVMSKSARRVDCSRSLGYLSNRLLSRYQQLNELTDLHDAIKYASEAVESTLANHSARPGHLINLAGILRERYKALGQPVDLERSIDLAYQVVEDSPKDHIRYGVYLSVLGAVLEDRSKITGSSEDLRCSFEAYRKAVYSVSTPQVRIRAAMLAIGIPIKEENWTVAADLADSALSLLPEAILPTNSRADKQDTLRVLSQLPSLIASIFLKAGRSPLEALQALEKARGIIAGFLIDARSDVSFLKEEYSELWARYTNCQAQIASIDAEFNLPFQGDSQRSYAMKSAQRQLLYQDLYQLRDEIRQCPGFERFLSSLKETEILDLAKEGPIVCFNISFVSSEAFLVTSTGIRALQLPELQMIDIGRQVKLFAARGNSARRDATFSGDDEDIQNQILFPNDPLAELGSLWNNAVKPVLHHLGLLEHLISQDALPRVWWIGGGDMAILPLHAAGEHSPGSTENAFSHIISSFATTLRSLQFTRGRVPVVIPEEDFQVLIVSMPTTPGPYKPLNVAGEVAAISKHSTSAASIIHLERPNRTAVLRALKSCTVAHFACHGCADPAEPAQSALLVGRDTQERLTVADLDEVFTDKTNAQVAYLSACSTAEIQALELANESIHLGSAFQLSGFRHVVGTLWGADDEAAVKIAGEFYRTLFQRRGSLGGEAGIGAKKYGNLEVARALHDAVFYYRNEGENWREVSKWAPFIHLGS
jgi:tetratricopeptide (TPR) repeat protein